MSHCHDSDACLDHMATPSVHQTLDELDFNRGIWQAAVDGDVTVVVRCLEERNIAVDQKDSSGYTAMHYASRNGHTTVCKTLLEHGADINIQTRSGQATALHRAAYCGHVEVVELLLNHGAHTTLSDTDGMVPLHKAAERGSQTAAEILVKASPNTRLLRDKKGRLPADCVPSNCPKLVKLLQVNTSTEPQSVNAT